MQYQQPRQFIVHCADQPACPLTIAERTFEAAAVAYLEHEHVEVGEVELVVIADDGEQRAFTLSVH